MFVPMKTKALRRKIDKLESDLVAQNEKLAALKRRLPAEEVKDYFLGGPDGKVRLSELFRGKRDLIVIHNMGRSCRYCTMWADGFNGLREHLSDRAAFAVVSPDAVGTQQKFAASRGWKFPFYSGKGSGFIKDMGFLPKPNEPMPGASTFRRKGRKLYRVASTGFGPFDQFCATWPLFALLDGGVGDWSPKYRYPKS
jgi:predicted dithiol-disulfide oxidoreductase (DUF899 family)